MARRNFLMETLNKDEVSKNELQEAFAVCDVDSSGYVPIRNLKVVMRALGFEPRNDEILLLTGKMMNNKALRSLHPESVGVDELAELLADKMEQRGGVNEMHAAFQLFDSDAKGFISVADLRNAANELSESIDEEQFMEMISEADSCNSGRVSEADFCAIMKKTSLY